VAPVAPTTRTDILFVVVLGEGRVLMS
jgi:hypothetical protein